MGVQGEEIDKPGDPWSRATVSPNQEELVEVVWAPYKYSAGAVSGTEQRPRGRPKNSWFGSI